MLLLDRLQVSQNGFRIGFTHTERHHGQAQRFAIGPDPRREELNHVWIAGGRISTNSRRFQGPVRIGSGRLEKFRGPLQLMGVIERAIAVPRRVTLRAHGDILDNVFAACDLRLSRGKGRSRCLVSLSLRTWWLLRIRYQYEEETRADEQQYRAVC